jgi:hypothetical protein
MRLLTRIPSALLTAVAGMILAAPLSALAQGGSALYAVGEPDSSARAGKKAAPKPAATGSAAAPKAGAPAVDATSQSAAPPAKKTRKALTRNRSRSKAPATSPIALGGRWHDSECIPLTGVTHTPPLYVKRQYEFDDVRKTWLLEAAVYTSNACLASARMLTYRGNGSFALIGKSRAASNAYDASFNIDGWSAVPHNRTGVLALLNGRCGSGDFEQGRSLDLSATGCPVLGIRSIAQSPGEVEPISVSNGRFFMGTRAFTPGLGDDRPAQLSSYGLVRTP